MERVASTQPAKPNKRKAFLGLAGLCFAIAVGLVLRVRSSPPSPFLVPHDLTDKEAADYDRQETLSLIACGGCPVFALAGIVFLIYAIPEPPE